MKREEILKRLHENELMKQALTEAKDDSSRRLAQVQAETLVLSIFDVLAPMLEKLQNDPEALKMAKSTFNHVFNDNTHVSGSIK